MTLVSQTGIAPVAAWFVLDLLSAPKCEEPCGCGENLSPKLRQIGLIFQMLLVNTAWARVKLQCSGLGS